MLNPSVYNDDARFLELLERWLQGDFTRTDERELYALTKTDEFRREAWEGFVSMPDGKHEVHLETIRRRLQRRPAGKQIPLMWWSAVAALMLAVLAAIYFIPARQFSEPVATAQEAAKPVPEVSRPYKGGDTTINSNTSVAELDEDAGLHKGKRILGPPTSRAKQDEVRTTDDLLASQAETNPVTKADTEAPFAQTPAATTGQPTFRDSLPNPYWGAAANANFPAKKKAPAASTKPAADSASQVSGSIADKKSEATTARSKMTTNAAIPAGGWDAFNRYLRDSARLTPAARNNNVSGYVRLQFDLFDQSGQPGNFKILHSLGYGCDEEAVRLVRSVYWQAVTMEPVVLEIPFVR